MKLTNTIRDAFIRAAMNDVPNVDYTEQIRKVACDDAVAALPPAVRKLWNDKATRNFLNLNHATYGRVSVAYPSDTKYGEARKLSPSAETAVTELADKAKAEKSARDSLQSRLRAVAYSMSTRKALAEALPEFAKYLPEDEAAALRTVPVIANVVADFVRAGWPKDKAPAKAKQAVAA